MIRLEMKIQYHINKEAAKILGSLSSKIDKYRWKNITILTGVEILPSNQSRVMEQVKFTYSPLEKTLKKTNKNNWDQEKKWCNKSFKICSKISN